MIPANFAEITRKISEYTMEDSVTISKKERECVNLKKQYITTASLFDAIEGVAEDLGIDTNKINELKNFNSSLSLVESVITLMYEQEDLLFFNALAYVLTVELNTLLDEQKNIIKDIQDLCTHISITISSIEQILSSYGINNVLISIKKDVVKAMNLFLEVTGKSESDKDKCLSNASQAHAKIKRAYQTVSSFLNNYISMAPASYKKIKKMIDTFADLEANKKGLDVLFVKFSNSYSASKLLRLYIINMAENMKKDVKKIKAAQLEQKIEDSFTEISEINESIPKDPKKDQLFQAPSIIKMPAVLSLSLVLKVEDNILQRRFAPINKNIDALSGAAKKYQELVAFLNNCSYYTGEGMSENIKDNKTKIVNGIKKSISAGRGASLSFAEGFREVVDSVNITLQKQVQDINIILNHISSFGVHQSTLLNTVKKVLELIYPPQMDVASVVAKGEMHVYVSDGIKIKNEQLNKKALELTGVSDMTSYLKYMPLSTMATVNMVKWFFKKEDERVAKETAEVSAMPVTTLIDEIEAGKELFLTEDPEPTDWDDN